MRNPYSIPVGDEQEQAQDMAGRKFWLSIRMGNDAMSSPADVAGALVSIASRIECDEAWCKEIKGNIMDENGNKVGCYGIE